MVGWQLAHGNDVYEDTPRELENNNFDVNISDLYEINDHNDIPDDAYKTYLVLSQCF